MTDTTTTQDGTGIPPLDIGKALEEWQRANQVVRAFVRIGEVLRSAQEAVGLKAQADVERAQLQGQIQDVWRELVRARAELSATELRRAEVRGKTERELTLDMDELTRLRETLGAERATLTAEVEALEAKRAALPREIDREGQALRLQRAAELEAEQVALRQAIEQAEGRRDALLAEIAAMQTRIGALLGGA